MTFWLSFELSFCWFLGKRKTWRGKTKQNTKMHSWLFMKVRFLLSHYSVMNFIYTMLNRWASSFFLCFLSPHKLLEWFRTWENNNVIPYMFTQKQIWLLWLELQLTWLTELAGVHHLAGRCNSIILLGNRTNPRCFAA